MTREKHLKERVRDRMLATGETYTQAREELRAAESADSRAEQLPAADSDTADASSESTVWVTALAHAYVKAIADFSEALCRCPADRWRKSVWIVKRSDPYAWPIHRGVGADMSDAKRLQLQSAFWNVAYHAIFHLDFGLEGGWKGTAYEPPSPFRGDDHFGNCLPWREYTCDELVEYLDYCDTKAKHLFGAMSGPSNRPKGAFADLLVGSLLHLNEHLAQLNLFLSR